MDLGIWGAGRLVAVHLVLDAGFRLGAQATAEAP